MVNNTGSNHLAALPNALLFLLGDTNSLRSKADEYSDGLYQIHHATRGLSVD